MHIQLILGTFAPVVSVGVALAGFHVAHFSHYFEFFAGLSLAYAGSDKFRRKVFDLLSAFLTSDDLEPALKSIADQKDTLKDIFGEGWSSRFLKKSQDIRLEFEKFTKRLAVDDERFLTDNSSTQSLFLIGALFCFNNLILAGFEQFHESSLLAEQWLCISAILMFVVVLEWPETVAKTLEHHLGVVAVSIILLVIGMSMDACPIEFPALPFGAPLVSVIAVIVPVIPFVLDYRAVSRHVTERNDDLRRYLERAKGKLDRLDALAELATNLGPLDDDENPLELG